mmetsp:Transcript_29325/g.49325  ORF Transcript_29325/g.49325 Transcript_29325/m.49325 type:complete len:227 (-) Transcript_29325:751-1431(-)
MARAHGEGLVLELFDAEAVLEDADLVGGDVGKTLDLDLELVETGTAGRDDGDGVIEASLVVIPEAHKQVKLVDVPLEPLCVGLACLQKQSATVADTEVLERTLELVAKVVSRHLLDRVIEAQPDILECDGSLVFLGLVKLKHLEGFSGGVFEGDFLVDDEHLLAILVVDGDVEQVLDTQVLFALLLDVDVVLLNFSEQSSGDLVVGEVLEVVSIIELSVDEHVSVG